MPIPALPQGSPSLPFGSLSCLSERKKSEPQGFFAALMSYSCFLGHMRDGECSVSRAGLGSVVAGSGAGHKDWPLAQKIGFHWEAF